MSRRAEAIAAGVVRPTGLRYDHAEGVWWSPAHGGATYWPWVDRPTLRLDRRYAD